MNSQSRAASRVFTQFAGYFLVVLLPLALHPPAALALSPVTLTLSATPNPAVYGQPVTLTAAISAGATGKITFYDGAKAVGVASITANQATLSTVELSSGVRYLRAYFPGDAAFSPGSSSTLPVSINTVPSLGFFPPLTYATGAAYEHVSGDFNRDGNLDLVLVNDSRNTTTYSLSILLGNGDGTFQPKIPYLLTSPPGRIVSDDFNRDGAADLAVVQSNEIAILLGNGNGTFQNARLIAGAAAAIISMTSADFNGDAVPDLASAYSSKFQIQLGNGDGTFQNAVTYSTTSQAVFSVVAGDLDADGKADLLVVTESPYLSVYRGVGDGTVVQKGQYFGGIFVVAPQVADINADGKMDVVALDRYGTWVVTFLGNGDGSLQNGTRFYPATSNRSGTLSVAIEDFNGDGNCDLAALASWDSSRVLMGSGSGTFASNPSFAMPAGYQPIAGDFNRDGIADLAVLDPAGGQLQVILGGAKPDLTLTLSHGAGLTQGQPGVYTISVINLLPIASNGPVAAAATLPAGVTATAISGSGWTCVLATLACSRSDALAPNATFPEIRIDVQLTANLTGAVTASATVSGGSDGNLANNFVFDTTLSRLQTTVSLVASPNPSTLGQKVTLTATVTSGATGQIAFFDGISNLGVAAVSSGMATFSTALLPSGIRPLRAVYTGDANYGPSGSSPYSLTVNPKPVSGYRAPASFDLAFPPMGVAVADYNRDGKPDVAIVGEGVMTIWVGDGNGHFQTSFTYSDPQSYYSSPFAGDFNNDGNPDLLLQNQLFLGNGDGTFKTPLIIATVSWSGGAVSDTNNDGRLDLIGLAGDSIKTVLGNGDGTFGAPITAFTIGSSVFRRWTVGDFNRDGKVDMLLAGIGILLGKGDGTFQNPINAVGPSADAESLGVGDFNGDGNLDVAVLDFRSVDVMFGNGDGTLQPPVNSTVAGYPWYFATSADINGDGNVDLAYPGYATDGLGLAFGDGTGHFPLSTIVSPAGYWTAFEFADLNLDGRLDFVVTNSSARTIRVFYGAQFAGLDIAATHTRPFTAGQPGVYSITVTNSLFQTASGAVTLVASLPAGFTASAIAGAGWQCTLATLTCSRNESLAQGLSYPPVSLTVNVAANLQPSVLTFTASVTWSGITNPATDPTVIVLATTTSLSASPNPSLLGQPVTLTATISPAATGVVTFSAAGIPIGSAAISSGQAILVTRLLPAGVQNVRASYVGDATHGYSLSNPIPLTVNAGQASGLTAAVSYPTGSAPMSIALADFNGDGKTDLAIGNAAESSVSVLLGNGNGTFQPKVDYSLDAGPFALTVTDFNGDARPDMAVISSSPSVSILLGQAGGGFQIKSYGFPHGVPPARVDALNSGDFNRDGKVDLAVGTENSASEIWLGNGDGTFVRQPAAIGQALAIGEVNLDADPDLISGRDNYLGNGDATFRSVYSNAPYNSPSVIGIGDLNGDGKPDLAVPDQINSVWVAIGSGDGTFAYPAAFPASGSPARLSIADVNGDGKLDVVTTTYAVSKFKVLRGNGDGTLQNSIDYTAGAAPLAVATGDFNGDGRTDIAVTNRDSNTVSILLGILTPVLITSSSHAGNFNHGQVGATYTLTAGNNGPGATSGVVTLIDTLPPGLTATAIAGAGWNCTLATLTCTRSDALGVGQSYPTVTVTVNVAPNAPALVTNTVSFSGGGGVVAAALDPTAVTPAMSLSVSPNSGSGARQQFAASFAALPAHPNLRWVQLLFAAAPNGGGQTYCFLHYDVPGNALWLYGDGGFFTGPVTPGASSNLLQNALCAINTSNSTVSGNGAALTLNAEVIFKAAEARNIYLRAQNLAGTDTGWIHGGTWTLAPAALGAMTSTPNSGTAATQAFALSYADPQGFSGAPFGWVQWLLAAAPDGGGQPFCLVHYDRAASRLWTYSSDLGYFAGPVTPGAASNQLNSTACSVDPSSATAANLNGSLLLTLPVILKPPMSGAKKIYQRTLDVLNRDTGWQQTGTWTLP